MIKVIRGHGGKGGVPISYLVPYKLFGILIYCVPRPQALNPTAMYMIIVVQLLNRAGRCSSMDDSNYNVSSHYISEENLPCF